MNINNQVEYWDREGATKIFRHPVNFDLLGIAILNNLSTNQI
ncbi:hypothetical protein [Mastigocoleus sp. MO_188.B34]|nr:hypothetical protein [Mastigocoleus sp. MO_188.B34]MDJ0695620.1 hypothetical protein [Mastigocoleus sp. MO_188.B34]